MNTSRSTRRSPKGFTLIEVLVVVAIIALLISILLPSLEAARRQARIVACGANLHTLLQGTMYYAQASKDDLPAGWYLDKKTMTNDYSKISANPWEFLYPFISKTSPEYGKEKSVSGSSDWVVRPKTYRCPDDKKQHTSSEFRVKTPTGMDIAEIDLSYVANYLPLFKDGIDYTTSHDTQLGMGAGKVSRIKNQSQLVLYGDGADDSTNGQAGWAMADCMADFGYNQCAFELRHKDGNNFGYLDAHVSFSKMNFTPKQYGLPSFPMSWVPNWSANHPNYGLFKDRGHTAPKDRGQVKTDCSEGC